MGPDSALSGTRTNIGGADDFTDARVHFTVNGTAADFDGRPSTPLLYVLRNELGLKGTRFGCGEGDCGACMVWIDGKPTASCQFPMSSAENAQITTIEGLASGETLHPVQRSILSLNAGQCGYCLNGIIVSAAALLAGERHPSRERIAEALDPHLCRCGAHHRILKAITDAAGAS